jgi:hypothetical protein
MPGDIAQVAPETSRQRRCITWDGKSHGAVIRQPVAVTIAQPPIGIGCKGRMRKISDPGKDV